MITPSIERRAEQPVPETIEAAAARFKCLAYLCDMAATCCTANHVKARATRDMAREACIECPAGAARVALLSVSADLPCMALPRGKRCGEKAAPGALFCLTHRHQRAGVDVGRGRPSKRAAHVGACPVCGARAIASHTREVCDRALARQAGERPRGRRGVPAGIKWDTREMRAMLEMMTTVELVDELGVSENTIRVARRARGINGPNGRALRQMPCHPCMGWLIFDGPDGPALKACTICKRIESVEALGRLPVAARALAQARAARGRP